VVDEVRPYLAGIDTELDFGVDLRVGKPDDVLVDLSATATMLVLGRRGHGVFADLLIGSTSDAVGNRGRGPVVVVPSGWQQQEHRNRPGPGRRRLDRVRARPAGHRVRRGPRRRARRSAHPRPGLGLPLGRRPDQPASAEDIDQWHDMADARGAELVEEWRAKRPGLEIVHAVHQGHPVEGLLAAAEDLNPQLLAVGGRPRSRLAEHLLGSTARGVLHHTTHPIASSTTPVVAVRLGDRPSLGRELGAAASRSS
jgi:nucleotide-binding universal stress UspA family protein